MHIPNWIPTALIAILLLAILPASHSNAADEPDLILHNGKIVTVAPDFAIARALSVKDGKILAVGNSDKILNTKGKNTTFFDLEGKTVLPGLIDSHTHAAAAAMYEFDHPVPQIDTIPQVLDYIRSRARALGDGQWIVVQQVFITRLREQRYPTRAELDRAAPRNPVVFRTGPDASVNTLALNRSGIDKNFKVTDGGPGHMETDPKTGEPTGILRGIRRYIKIQPSGKQPTETDRRRQLAKLLKDYNAVGITSIAERSAGPELLDRYQALRRSGDLTVRVALSRYVATLGPIEDIQEKIREIARHPLTKDDPLLRVIGVKVYLDGGMLTGSAYMRQPWGVSKIYSIDDPEYRGVRFIPHDRLLPIARTAVENDLQFTAHSVGDGAVHALLDVYEELCGEMPIRHTRPCISHSNFMSRQAVEQAARLGVALDIQPAWLYLDARTLTDQFGNDRLRYFQPLASIFKAGAVAGGGTDHMQKIGSLRSINPYNPFLGMWIAHTRQAKWYEGRLHPQEALTREQMIRFYTVNNAHILRQEQHTGSLEPGKQADFVILDRDPLTCPEDAIKETQVLKTYLSGQPVFHK